MRLSRGRFTHVAAVTFGVAVAASMLTYQGAASPLKATSASAPKFVVHEATTLTIPTLDGIMSNSVESTKQIYDALARITGQGGLAHDLATEWSSNPAGTQWTFKIRKGVLFHDGTTLKPSDIAWTFNKVIATPTSLVRGNIAPYLGAGSSITTTADTVVFNLSAPLATWPRQTSLVPIVPEAAYTKLGPEVFATKPVGSGPWKVVGFNPNTRLVVTANLKYWAGRPAVGYVTEDIITDETARLNALRSGAIDVATLSPVTAGAARADKKLKVVSVPSNLVTYIGINVTTGDLANPKLRQAISAAIDRAAIAKTLYNGDAVPTGQLLAPVSFGYDPNVKAPTFNLNDAKSLVSQSGYNGQTFNMTYPQGPALPGADQLAQAVQGYLQAAGINIRLVPQDQATFISDWLGRRFTGLYLFSFQPSTLDGALVYNLLMHSANYAVDQNAESFFQQQGAQPAVPARLALLQKLGNSLVQQDGWFVPLIVNGRVYAWNPAKVRVTPRADGYLYPQFFKKPIVKK